MSKELFFIGESAPFKEGISIRPPKVKEVIGNINYSAYVKILTYSQEEIEDEFVKAKKKLDSFPTPFEFLLNNSYHSKQYEKLALEAFEFFIGQKVSFLYEQKIILVGDLKEILQNINKIDELSQLVTITEDDFFSFQNLVREAIGKKTIEPPNPNENPRIKAMKAKARYRDKIKEKQAEKQGTKLFTIFASICCMGLGINPLNIGEMSYVSMGAILAVYQNKEKYELDIDSLLAGADSKKIKPKYWIRNLEE